MSTAVDAIKAAGNVRCCAECGARNPELVERHGLLVCRHRSACEARQMLTAGHSAADAARHAQRSPYERLVDKFAGYGWPDPASAARVAMEALDIPRNSEDGSDA